MLKKYLKLFLVLLEVLLVILRFKVAHVSQKVRKISKIFFSAKKGIEVAIRGLRGGKKFGRELTDKEMTKIWVNACKPENLQKFHDFRECFKFLKVRQEIFERSELQRFYGQPSIEDKEEIKKADMALFKMVLKEGGAKPDFCPDGVYSYSCWWWHMDKIARRIYPAQFLFEYEALKSLYLKAFEGFERDVQSKSDKELVKDWETYASEDSFCMIPVYDHRQARSYLCVRDEIHKRGLDEDPKVMEIDLRLIKYLVTSKQQVKTQDVVRDLKYWWWHLDKIVKRTYPADLLPKHLQETYLYEDILESWEMAGREYKKGEILACNVWMGSSYLALRDRIHEKGLDNHPRVKQIDKGLIKFALEHGVERPYDPSDEEHDLQYWWWYLEKIGKREYPAELLPEHLREIYQEHLKKPKC